MFRNVQKHHPVERVVIGRTDTWDPWLWLSIPNFAAKFFYRLPYNKVVRWNAGPSLYDLMTSDRRHD
jgi:hypothetical protein